MSLKQDIGPPPYSIKAWQTANLLKPFSGIQIEDVEMCLLNLCEILLLWWSADLNVRLSPLWADPWAGPRVSGLHGSAGVWAQTGPDHNAQACGHPGSTEETNEGKTEEMWPMRSQHYPQGVSRTEDFILSLFVVLSHLKTHKPFLFRLKTSWFLLYWNTF